jgi:Kef-type K+ transport system membrane component KefB
LSVGGASSAVAITGVVVPFAAGFGVGWWLDYPTTVSVFLGAATATSVGITREAISDDDEGREGDRRRADTAVGSR